MTVTKFDHVFVTVGTTRFDDLLATLLSDHILESLIHLGCRKLVIQAGKSDVPKHSFDTDIEIIIYDYKESIADDISEADLVIGHSGAGTTLEVLRNNKTFVSVINSSLMDNHQLELAQQLQQDGHLIYCYPETLSSTLNSLQQLTFRPLPVSDPSTFPKFVDHAMGFS